MSKKQPAQATTSAWSPMSVDVSAPPAQVMIPIADVVDQVKSAGLGYERVGLIKGSTYKDNSTIVICPTRGMIHHRVVSAFMGMLAPMNQKKVGPLFAVAPVQFATEHEVGKAYDAMIGFILQHPELSKFKYILTLEDDNLPPPDALIRLLESIEETRVDAISGIYWTKGEYNMPQAYGDPDEYRRTGVLDFRPRDVREALSKGHIMEVNGCAMGCALWRMDLFKQIPAPWFVTVSDVIPEKGPMAFTQDLYFWVNAKKAGKRVAIDFRVKVGHLDTATNVVY